MDTYLLTGANVALAVVVVVIVQLIKFFLPAPAPEVIGDKVNRFSVSERWKWIPFYSAVLLSIGLSIALDPHKDQSFVGKLFDGLQTGAYAIAIWEAYSQSVQRIIDRVRNGT